MAVATHHSFPFPAQKEVNNKNKPADDTHFQHNHIMIAEFFFRPKR